MKELTLAGLTTIILEKDQTTDYQKHLYCDEEVCVLLGTGSYVLGDEEEQFMEGDMIYIPTGTPYRFKADDETVLWKMTNNVQSETGEPIVKLKDDIRK